MESEQTKSSLTLRVLLSFDHYKTTKETFYEILPKVFLPKPIPFEIKQDWFSPPKCNHCLVYKVISLASNYSVDLKSSLRIRRLSCKPVNCICNDVLRESHYFNNVSLL